MGRLIFLNVLLLAITACEQELRGPNALAIGDSIRSVELTDTERNAPLVLWVFRSDDCLDCQAPTAALRRIQNLASSGIRLHLIGIGVDSSLVEGFLRRERINAPISLITDEQYRKQFGNAITPELYFIQHRRIESISGTDLSSAMMFVTYLEERSSQ